MSGEELERRSGPSPARSTKVIPGVILEIWNLDEFMLRCPNFIGEDCHA